MFGCRQNRGFYFEPFASYAVPARLRQVAWRRDAKRAMEHTNRQDPPNDVGMTCAEAFSTNLTVHDLHVFTLHALEVDGTSVLVLALLRLVRNDDEGLQKP